MFDIGIKRVALGITFIVLNKYFPPIEQLPSRIARNLKTLLSTGGIGFTLLGLKSMHVGFQSINQERETNYLKVGLASFALGITALTTRAIIYIYEN